MKYLSAFIIGCCIATVIVLAQCQRSATGPVAIEANDMCSFCRMSISEKRYAAELIDEEGNVFKFDDIGCMANFIKRNNAKVHAIFVMDFDRREWLKAENAFYVRSSELRTPMNGGIVAFKDQPGAAASIAKYHGAKLEYPEVTK